MCLVKSLPLSDMGLSEALVPPGCVSSLENEGGGTSAPGAWVPAWLSAAEAGQKLGDICTGPWTSFEARGECVHQDKRFFWL